MADPARFELTTSEWVARYRTLKAVIDAGELAATLRGPSANKSAVIRLSDLRAFALSHPGAEWNWLREFCHRWAEARGEESADLFDLHDLEGEERDGSLDQYRTGAPGRPTIMHLIRVELERRISAGEVLATLAAQAEALRGWAATTHPTAPTPTSRTIQNGIRELYNRHAQDKRTK